MLLKTPATPKLKSAVNWNDQAFTLIEALFALTIFMIIIFFITPIFHVILDQKESQVKLQAMEWEVFCSQLKKEIRLSTQVKLGSGEGQLILTKGSETILYDQYETNLRRRVNFTGHEIVLQNVAKYSFALLPNAVKVIVIDKWGKEHSVIAYSLVEWKAGT
ncbi:competence type IV pilus minor pilin ComGF [Neobacillus kokaensis]|uniref:Competence protein comGF n=1 Tax=Neobacillus kokaensis TaxID=2759023 RepID=A0ABQ3MWC2_9BACI|nr:competence type IV pilus minor pilin ComGF [Neobacillus kokaensis]GHH96983.1 hypothetical protein AM1BK_05260 [Neobacillus kokaensis]